MTDGQEAEAEKPKDYQVFETTKTIDSWDEDYYHPIAERYYDRAIERMIRLMDVGPGERVLDAGCGPGVHSVRVARLGHPVTAIDISNQMLEEARRRVERAGVADLVTFQREDLTALSFPDASFKRVFSWGVIIHIPRIDLALEQLARVVEPGGTLALYVTNESSLDYAIENTARAVARKPLRIPDRRFGTGIEYTDYHGEKLWLWRVDSKALTQFLSERGFQRTHRVSGQFSEIQRRLPSLPRQALLQFNNLYYRLGLPASMAITNLLVFRKNA